MSDGKSFTERIIDQDHLLRPGGPADRVQHLKKIFAAFGVVRINDDIPDEAKPGPFVSGTWVAACRFSNGQPIKQKDQAPDVRGVAVKFFVGDQEVDLLATNEGGRSHARNTAEFVDLSDAIAAKLADGTLDFVELLGKELVGAPLDTAHSLGILTKEVFLHRVESLTTEAYWGSVVELAGRPIKYSVQPHPSTAAGTNADRKCRNFLREDLLKRLSQGPIRFNLCLQFFQDENTTPVNDASVKWETPLIEIGELEISTPPSPGDVNNINQMAFNPGHGFAPLGITKDRKEIYAASARNRSALKSDEVRQIFHSKIAAGGA